MTTKYVDATNLMIVMGLMAVMTGLSAKLLGYERIVGHDPVLVFAWPVLIIWTLGVAYLSATAQSP